MLDKNNRVSGWFDKLKPELSFCGQWLDKLPQNVFTWVAELTAGWTVEHEFNPFWWISISHCSILHFLILHFLILHCCKGLEFSISACCSFQPSLQSFGAANISDVDRGRVLTFFAFNRWLGPMMWACEPELLAWVALQPMLGFMQLFAARL